METKIDEIGEAIYRLSTLVPEIAAPAGFTFNEFLILGEEPLLFHCGLRKMFPLVSAAVARVIPLQQLRWITFGHFEADECGSMNEWLAAAPRAEVAHGAVGSMVSIADMADRPPRVLANGEVIDLGHCPNHSSTGRSRATHTGRHARLVVLRRWREPASGVG